MHNLKMQMEEITSIIPDLCKKLEENNYELYEKSFTDCLGVKILFVRFGSKKKFLAVGSGSFYDELQGDIVHNIKVCPLSHGNRLVINKYLDYTNPRAFGKNTATIGLGDRLGLATPAHIRSIIGRGIKPVLAQQSKRELVLTGRSYRDVLDDVCYAVLTEGYKDGFGADGDHLKNEEDIEEALSLGYSIITLDCSEKIDLYAENCNNEELIKLYKKLPLKVKQSYENEYLSKKHHIGNGTIEINKVSLVRNVLIYHEAIQFIEYIYEKYIRNNSKENDFEVSLDETTSSTTLLAHYLVANELLRKGISINSMAPRFVGEFQKGIDYIGNLKAFEEDLAGHAEIADHFGYKLSIHSGSDKFSTFKPIGEKTNKRMHIKTSGTSWLEAVRVIINKNPGLYREMHNYALLHFQDAKAYYHVVADPSVLKDVYNINGDKLQDLMEDKNARQLMHITYGFLLKENQDEVNNFRDSIYKTLMEYSDTYADFLIKHIGRHLDLLGFYRND